MSHICPQLNFICAVIFEDPYYAAVHNVYTILKMLFIRVHKKIFYLVMATSMIAAIGFEL